MLVALIVASAHYHQWKLAKRGSAPSPSEAAEEEWLWELEREIIAAKRTAAQQAKQKAAAAKQQLQQQQKKQSAADAHPLSEGAVAGAGAAAARVQRCVRSCVRACAFLASIPSVCVLYNLTYPCIQHADGTSRAAGAPSRPRTLTTTSSSPFKVTATFG